MKVKKAKSSEQSNHKRREVLNKLDQDYKKLYVKMNRNFTMNNWESLTREEIEILDAGKDPDPKRQKEYDKGRNYYTSLMAMKAKHLELMGLIDVSVNDKGDLVFEPGPNYKPEVIQAEQRPATALEILEANKPSEGVAIMKSIVERVAPNLKRV